jgi:hypothetical protein
MLNACCKMTRFYTQRHDAVVDRLEEAINMLIKPSGEIFKNKIVRIDGEFTINGKAIKSQIRPDIWFWDQEADIKGLIPEKVLRLHLIEVKVPWGGVYNVNTEEETNTLNKVRNYAHAKYVKAAETL